MRCNQTVSNQALSGASAVPRKSPRYYERRVGQSLVRDQYIGVSARAPTGSVPIVCGVRAPSCSVTVVPASNEWPCPFQSSSLRRSANSGEEAHALASMLGRAALERVPTRPTSASPSAKYRSHYTIPLRARIPHDTPPYALYPVGNFCDRDIIAEIGTDMSPFPTVGHLVSWAGSAVSAAQPELRTALPGLNLRS
jgi:hypothetical protein